MFNCDGPVLQAANVYRRNIFGIFYASREVVLCFLTVYPVHLLRPRARRHWFPLVLVRHDFMNPSSVILDQQSSPLALENIEKVAGQVDETDLDLLPFFEEEARAELKKIESVLYDWHGNNPSCPLEPLRRQLHTLKGAANSIGQLRIGALAGGLKDSLDTFHSAQALASRAEITKVCVMTLEVIKVLLKEARAPLYNPVKKESILKVAQAILDLKKKSEAQEPL